MRVTENKEKHMDSKLQYGYTPFQISDCKKGITLEYYLLIGNKL